jgi:5-methylcytosine-specific restriction endonuclease McrA
VLDAFYFLVYDGEVTQGVNMETKICSTCGQEKPATLEFFNPHRRRADGLNKNCKACWGGPKSPLGKAKAAKAAAVYREKQAEKLGDKFVFKTKAVTANRAAHLKNIPGKVTPEEVGAIYQDTCYYCGRAITADNSHLDHVISMAKGGHNIVDNLRFTCHSCNRAKGPLNGDEFKAELRSLYEGLRRIYG